jgi:hypothetical protein
LGSLVDEPPRVYRTAGDNTDGGDMASAAMRPIYTRIEKYVREMPKP